MKEPFGRHRLPHWDNPGAVYFVTVCLEGSIPHLGSMDLEEYHASLVERPPPSDLSEREWDVRMWKLWFARMDRWLDQQPAVADLKQRELAEEVEQALLGFAGIRYVLWSWVVMPSHFHCVFEPIQAWVKSLGDAASFPTPRDRIMQSVMRASAEACHGIRGRNDVFWQEESYGHFVDDDDELERVVDYVEMNPVRARLVAAPEEYRFSSAYYRHQNRVPIGHPLVGESQLRDVK